MPRLFFNRRDETGQHRLLVGGGRNREERDEQMHD
jgi:hypothetical protein